MFELIGAGEVAIDEVQLRLWEPPTEPVGRPPLRPIAAKEDTESTKR